MLLFIKLIIDFSNKDLYNYKYIPLLRDKKRYIFLMGGGGSGKSVFESQKEIIKSFEIKGKIMCVRKVKDTLKDSMFAELCRRISEWNLGDQFVITKSPMLIVNKLSGCEFIFKGLDDPEKIKSVEGVERVRIEEATELEKQDFDQIDLRLRGKKEMQITCTFNPTDAEHWLNVDHWRLGDTDKQTCLHSTYLDNRFVGEQYKTVMDRLMETNTNYYNIYALGQRGRLEGLIYGNRSLIDEVPETAKIICRGIDFGFTNDPTALVSLYKINNAIVLDENIYEHGLTNADIDARATSLGLDKSVKAYADSSEPKSIEELYRRRWNIAPVEKGKDSIKFGVDLLKQFELYITKRSTNIQKEIKKYCREIDKKTGKPTNTPIDKDNHAMDAIRYGAMMAFDTRPKQESKAFTPKRYPN